MSKAFPTTPIKRITLARIAPLTQAIGLVPTAIVTHTEPFHIWKAIATLDYVSSGRAGIRVKVSARVDEALLFGRRDIAAANHSELFDEARDYVEVLRRQLATAAEWRGIAEAKNLSIRKLMIEVTGHQSFITSPQTIADEINRLVQATAT